MKINETVEGIIEDRNKFRRLMERVSAFNENDYYDLMETEEDKTVAHLVPYFHELKDNFSPSSEQVREFEELLDDYCFEVVSDFDAEEFIDTYLVGKRLGELYSDLDDFVSGCMAEPMLLGTKELREIDGYEDEEIQWEMLKPRLLEQYVEMYPSETNIAAIGDIELEGARRGRSCVANVVMG